MLRRVLDKISEAQCFPRFFAELFFGEREVMVEGIRPIGARVVAVDLKPLWNGFLPETGGRGFFLAKEYEFPDFLLKSSKIHAKTASRRSASGDRSGKFIPSSAL